MPFSARLLEAFLVALGVDLGGALLVAAGAALTGEFPLRRMTEWATELKLWGVLAALGGSFEPLRQIEAGLFAIELRLLVKEVLVVIVALAGAHVAHLILTSLAGKPP